MNKLGDCIYWGIKGLEAVCDRDGRMIRPINCMECKVGVSKCVHADNKDICVKLSDDVAKEYCVEGPCPDMELMEGQT